MEHSNWFVFHECIWFISTCAPNILLNSLKSQWCARKSLGRYPVCYFFLRLLLWSLRHVKWNYTLDEAGGRKLRFWLKHRTSSLCYVILELLHNLLKIFSRWHYWLFVSFFTHMNYKYLYVVENMDSQKVCWL